MVDGVIDERPARCAKGVCEPAGLLRAGPRAGQAGAEHTVGADQISDAPVVDPLAELDIGGKEAPGGVVREVVPARTGYRGGEGVSFGKGESERLDRHHVLSRLERADRERGVLLGTRETAHDINVVALNDLIVGRRTCATTLMS